MQERNFPLSHCLSGVNERRVNVLRLQVGKRSKNVFLRHSFREHADHCRDWNTQTANARNSVHLLWIDSYSAHDRGTGGIEPQFRTTRLSIPLAASGRLAQLPLEHRRRPGLDVLASLLRQGQRPGHRRRHRAHELSVDVLTPVLHLLYAVRE